ncbi:hypothetical protein FACS1894177_03240 [Bacteroidia bacterium]|nr:hypothetical protein FACS1894177_03240 [Bacteroidia bacterium]
MAGRTQTLADAATFAADIHEKENSDISRPTFYDYLDCLKRLMLIEEQPAWSPHLRSAALLRKSPKIHFTDVCLSVAAIAAMDALQSAYLTRQNTALAVNHENPIKIG